MTTRRIFLQGLAAAPLLTIFQGDALAQQDARIKRLMREARVHEKISQRIDFISRSLLGTRYQTNTLIGSARKQEIFVVRDDAFDCITYCEVVLAAAIAQDMPEFEAVLHRIRYENGEVHWNERNHYFAEWSRRSVENHICKPVAVTPSVPIVKTVNWADQGKRRVSMEGISAQTLLASRQILHVGDIIGFVSRRPYLDVFHVGFVAFGKNGALMVRHASQSRGRVLDEPIAPFLAKNDVRYVTLLRAEDPTPAAV